MLVTTKEYAALYGLKQDSVKHKCLRGTFKTARKFGTLWVLDSDEPNTDNRFKTKINDFSGENSSEV